MPIDAALSTFLVERFSALTEDVVRLLRQLEPADAQRPVDGSTWTVGETAAHVCSLLRRMTEDGRRSTAPADLAELNDLAVGEIGLDVAATAEEIETRAQLVVVAAPHIAPDRQFKFHAGQQVTLTQALAVVVGELVVHGAELAAAVGASWPIAPDDMLVVWRYATPVLQGWLRPEASAVTETWSLQFPDDDRPVVVRVDAGWLDIDPDPAPTADHVVTIDDTVAFTLAFPYGRGVLSDPAASRLAALFLPL
jgi:hypothetical protein